MTNKLVLLLFLLFGLWCSNGKGQNQTNNTPPSNTVQLCLDSMAYGATMPSPKTDSLPLKHFDLKVAISSRELTNESMVCRNPNAAYIQKHKATPQTSKATDKVLNKVLNNPVSTFVFSTIAGEKGGVLFNKVDP